MNTDFQPCDECYKQKEKDILSLYHHILYKHKVTPCNTAAKTALSIFRNEERKQ